MVNKSMIPHIERPKFKPSIPEYMVDKIENDESRFVIEQLSVIKQQNAWQADKVAEIYDYTRKINGKVIELEEFRQFILNEKEKAEEVTAIVTEKDRKNRKLSVILSISFALFFYPIYISFFNGVGPDGVVNGLLNYFVTTGGIK